MAFTIVHDDFIAGNLFQDANKKQRFLVMSYMLALPISRYTFVQHAKSPAICNESATTAAYTWPDLHSLTDHDTETGHYQS